MPKVIIFVKDRVVAEYLKNLLQKHVELSKENDSKKLLSSVYKVDMAMGPRGKNLVNKAYRSTNQNQELDEDPDDSFVGVQHHTSQRDFMKFRAYIKPNA